MNDQHHYLSFQVGSQWYGIKVEAIVEIFYLMTLTELPVPAPGVLGLMTVRDSVIPVIDMRRRFGLTNAPFKLSTPIITVSTSSGQVGLVVDDVDNVERISADQLLTYQGPEFPYVTGVVKFPERLLLLLNPDLITRDAQHLDVAGQTASESA